MNMTQQQKIGRASALPHSLDLRADWDRNLAAYELAKITDTADRAFGPLAVAYRAWDELQRTVSHEYGSWERAKATVDGAVHCDRGWQKLSAAEEQNSNQHLEPVWGAARVLVRTPAPDVAAIKRKLELIEVEELWNDSCLEEDCWELVQADVARLRGEG